MKRYLWMYVSEGRLELPLAVALSSFELSQMIGVDGNTIRTAIHNAKKRGHKSRYKKVEITEEEYQEFLKEKNNDKI